MSRFDDTRIRAALPMIEELRGLGATIVLASHLGRPHGSDPALSLRPVAERLQQLTDASVMLAPAVVGEEVRDLTRGGTARSCCSRTCALSPVRPPMTRSWPGRWPSSRTPMSMTPSAPLTALMRVRRCRSLTSERCGTADGARSRRTPSCPRESRPPAGGRDGRRQGRRKDRGRSALPAQRGPTVDRWRDGDPIHGCRRPRRRRLALRARGHGGRRRRAGRLSWGPTRASPRPRGCQVSQRRRSAPNARQSRGSGRLAWSGRSLVL